MAAPAGIKLQDQDQVQVQVEVQSMSVNLFLEYERWYMNYWAYLQRLAIYFSGGLELNEETDTEDETDSDDEESIPDGMLIATPEGSDWGDDLDDLPGMEEISK